MKKLQNKIIAVVFFSILFSTSKLFTQDIRFTPDERISEEACITEIMEPTLFIQTALIASGASSEDIPNYLNTLQNLSVELHKNLSEQNEVTDEQKAEYVLTFLYEKVFSKYITLQTRINTALDDGTYNCVSSTILYMYFAKTIGIPVIAVSTPIHAFCTIAVGGKNIDVETTNPYGFAPGVKKNLSNDESKSKRWAVIPARNYNNRINVDDRRIICAIYSNRIADAQRDKKDADTIGLAFDAYRLQNYSDNAKTNVINCICNTATSLSDKKDYQDALDLLIQGETLLGKAQNFEDNKDYAVGKMIEPLVKNNNFDEASEKLEENKKYLSDKNYTNYFRVVHFNRLNYSIDNNSFEESYKQIKNYESLLSKKDYSTLLSYCYSSEAHRVSENDNYLAAADLLENALNELPNDSGLKTQYNAYLRNYASSVHNKAVRYVNSGDYKTARQIILDGLKNYANSTLLQNDLKRLPE